MTPGIDANRVTADVETGAAGAQADHVSRLRRHWVALATLATVGGIVSLALLLRFTGLGWGRPFVYHPDEWVIVDPALNMVRTGSWDPQNFTYPSAMIYLERVLVWGLHHVDSISLTTNASGGYAGLPWRNGSNPLPEQFPYFYLGRSFVAMVGAATAIPVFLAGRRASNLVGGLVAAVAIAVAPLAVSNSHYLTTDVPTAALAAVTLFLALRAIEGRRAWLLAAGFAAGLAASTKYNGGLVVIVPLVVLLTSMTPRQWLSRTNLAWGLGIAVAAFAGFALLTPAVLLRPGDVWTGGILYQIQAYASGHPGAQGSDNFVYYLGVLWSGSGLGPGISILASVGLIVAIVERRRSDLAVLSFAFAYYVLISVPVVRFDRNLLPLLPFFAVLAGRGAGRLVGATAAVTGRLRRATAPARLRETPLTPHWRLGRSASAGFVLLLAALLGLPSIESSVAADQELRQIDTRTVALTWIESNLATGSTIAREEFTPEVPNDTYRVGYEYRLSYKSLGWYQEKGFEYVVASSYLFGTFVDDAQQTFYSSLFDQRVVLDLRPRPGQPGPRIVIVAIGCTNPIAPGSASACSP